jgi:putative transposase
MRYDPLRHHRRSIRLREYDYALAGSFFITICTHERECLFGDVEDDEVQLNELGRIARDEWDRSAKVRRELETGGFVVMPNHIHGIVHIMSLSDVGASGARPDGSLPRLPRKSLGAFVAGFKSAVTRRINTGRDAEGAAVWQRNYYEHIIRNEEDLSRIEAYIEDNPRFWNDDEYHP